MSKFRLLRQRNSNRDGPAGNPFAAAGLRRRLCAWLVLPLLLLTASAAAAQTCADMDGDGIAEACGPTPNSGSSSQGSAPDYAAAAQRRAEIAAQRAEAAVLANNAGNDWLARGEIDRAIAAYREALEYDGGNAVIRSNLAHAEGIKLYGARDYSGALTKFNRAISLSRRSADAVRRSMAAAGTGANADGVTRFRIGDYAGALRFYRQALALNPATPGLRHNIATAEACLAGRKGDFALAARKLDEAASADPSRVLDDIRVTIAGWAAEEGARLTERGDWRGAVQSYREAIAINPENAQARARLALLQGRNEPAADTTGAGWKVYFTDQAQKMFGPAGRGNFASKAECEAYIHSSPLFEQRNSRCDGADIGNLPPSEQAQSGPPRQDAGLPSDQDSSPGQPRKPTAPAPAPANGAASVPTSPPNAVTSAPPPALPLQASDFAPPSTGARSPCAVGSTASQDAVRAGRLADAARRLRDAIATCRGAATRTLLNDRLALIEREIAARRERAAYPSQPAGLIGGTTWEFEAYYRDLPANLPPAERARLNEEFRQQLRRAGISAETFAAARDYDFILGLAMSDSASVDLVQRVMKDEVGAGEYSRQTRKDYDSLRGRHFDVLDCHSNGAMICLAALKSGDVTARKVRLLGPQLSYDAALAWRELLDQGGLGNKIQQLEVVIAEGDPVPPGSFLSGDLLKGDPSTIKEAFLGDALPSAFVGERCVMDALRGCYDLPRPKIIRLKCEGRRFAFSIEACHAFPKYRRDLDALGEH